VIAVLPAVVVAIDALTFEPGVAEPTAAATKAVVATVVLLVPPACVVADVPLGSTVDAPHAAALFAVPAPHTGVVVAILGIVAPPPLPVATRLPLVHVVVVPSVGSCEHVSLEDELSPGMPFAAFMALLWTAPVIRLSVYAAAPPEAPRVAMPAAPVVAVGRFAAGTIDDPLRGATPFAAPIAAPWTAPVMRVSV